MKPVSLRMAGLQSYREAQEIDFRKLGEVGIFGIFGPTGSGKSSILDAMTLALYGNVERAANRTRGIMNHHEPQLMVSLTFELMVDGARTTFRVDRRYKRGAGDTVSSSHARLIRIGTGIEEVIAEKEKEVTAEVTRIIGLSIEDFTRAVVLPQGKFAEFLSLKDSDRTKMLQRLFSLDEYGQRLTDRVRRRLDGVRSRIMGLEGERRGLGDCSDETMCSVTSHRDSLKESLETVGRAFMESQAKRQDLEQLRGWLHEYAGIAESLARHGELAHEMAETETRLGLAAKAGPVMGLASVVGQAESRKTVLSKDLDSARADLDGAAAALKSAQEAENLLMARREREEPTLMKTLGELEQARSLEEACVPKKAEYDSLVSQGEALKAEIEGLDADSLALGGRIASLKETLAAIRAEISANTVDPGERGMIAEAVNILGHLTVAEERLSKEQAELDSLMAGLDKARAGVVETGATVDTAAATMDAAVDAISRHMLREPDSMEGIAGELARIQQLKSLFDGLVGIEGSLGALRAEYASKGVLMGDLRNRLQEGEARLAVILQEEVVLESALSLAREGLERRIMDEALKSAVHVLREGEPCPLCGSLHHPSPLGVEADDVIDGGTPDDARAKVAGIEQRLSGIRDRKAAVLTENAGTAQALLATKETLDETNACITATITKANEMRDTLPIGWETLETPELRERIASGEAALQATIEVRREWASKLETLQGEEKAAAKVLSEARLGLVAAQGALDTLQANSEAQRTRVNSCAQGVLSARSDFGKLCGMRDPLEIKDRAVAIAACDQRLSALGSDEVRFRSEMEECTVSLQGLGVAREAKERELTTLRTQATERLRFLQETVRQVRVVTGGKDPTALIAEAETAIAGLRAGYEAARSQASRALQEWNDCRGRTAALEAELSAAVERVLMLRERLDSALSAAGFADVDQATAAAIDDEKMLHMRNGLESYRKKGEMLKIESERLQGLIDGRSLDEGEWEGFMAGFTALQEHLSSLTRDLAVAEDQLRRLDSDRAKWTALTAMISEEETTGGYLHQLTGYLKGNAFVQFMAEEHLREIANDASKRLSDLTSGRYSLELGSDGDFVVRDNLNGGQVRSVGTLSGGETFLTSLCLALSLSSQIQLRGESPLEFFFLDEGFGTLDQSLLDTVVSVLERLHGGNMTIGVISHVPELRARIPRRLIVTPATETRGSRLGLEVG